MFLGNNFSDIEHILLYAATFEEYPIDRKLEFVKEWAMKSQKRLFTFADIPHTSKWYVCILQEDKYFMPKIVWQIYWPLEVLEALVNTNIMSVTSVGISFVELYREVEWCCLIWEINARFLKKMADSSQLIISLTLQKIHLLCPQTDNSWWTHLQKLWWDVDIISLKGNVVYGTCS